MLASATTTKNIAVYKAWSQHCTVTTCHGALSLSLPPAHPPFFPAGSPLCGRWASLSALRTGHAAFIAMCIA